LVIKVTKTTTTKQITRPILFI